MNAIVATLAVIAIMTIVVGWATHRSEIDEA